MTLNELLSEVAALGFESNLGADSAFLSAANRALRLIYSELSIQGKVRVLAGVPSPLSHIPYYRHTGEGDARFPLCGIAYSFKVEGRGAYTVRDADGERSFTFDTGEGGESAQYGLLRAPGELVFQGEYYYTVCDLCCYDSLLSDGEGRIPLYTERVRYPVAERLPDFLCFAREPCDSQERPLAEATLEDGALWLPRDYTGEVHITYRRRPRTVTSDLRDATVDISGEGEVLLPLLTAAYLWLDDDSEKAQYYMALYREAVDRIRRYHVHTVLGHYRDVTGWG